MSSSDFADTRRMVQEKYENVSYLEFREIRSWEEQINPQELQQKFDLAKGDVLDRYMKAVGIGNLNHQILMDIGEEICHEN